MAPSTTDAARLWRDTRVAYGDDAAQALAAFARLRKSGDFRDAVRTQEIPHIPEHALAAAHGRAGEGSRGGHIVRHTASGHAVYGPSIGGRTRKTSMPVDVLHQAAARTKAKSEDRHRQMSDAEREFAEGPNTVRRPYRTLHEEVYGEPLGKARRVKPGAGQAAFDFTAAPAAAPAPAPAPAADEVKQIGRTTSGRPVYDQHDHPGHANFSPSDHWDAAMLHRSASGRVFDEALDRLAATEESKRRGRITYLDIRENLTDAERAQVVRHNAQEDAHITRRSHMRAAPAAKPAAPAPAAMEAKAPAATLEEHLKAQRAHIILAAHHKAMAALDGADDESKAQHQEARQFHVDAGDKHGEAAARAKQMGLGATTPYGGTAERQRAIERSALLHDVEASAHHREHVENAAKRDLAMDDHARRVYGHMATASAKADMAHRTAAKALYEAHDTARLEHASLLANAAHKATAEERETARWAARQTLLRVPPKGAGWVPIPGSQHGGWHKHTGTHWLYWYPGDEEPHTTARAGDAQPEPAAKPQPAVATSKPAEAPWISRRSRGKGDNYTVGQIVALKKMRGGGGAEGNLFEVVKVHRKWKDNDTDEWMIGADVRPATGPKADKIDREKQAAKDKADAVASTVALIAQTGVTVPEQDARKLPDGDVFVVNAGVHGSGVEAMRLTPDGRAVWFHGGHYDDYRATQRVSTDPAAVTALRSLLAMKKSMSSGTVDPPAGYEPIPHSKHGGWRKHKASGGYRYWYPGQHSLMGPHDENNAEQEYAHRRAHHAVQASQHEAQAHDATHQAVKDAHRHAEATHRDVLRAMKPHDHGSALPKQPHDRDSERADRQTSNADDVETAAKEGRFHDALPPGTWSRYVYSQASAWGGKLAQVTKLSSHGGMSAGYDPVSRTRGYIVRPMVDGAGKPIDADPDDHIMGHVLGTHVKIDRPDEPYNKVTWQVGTHGYGTAMMGRYGEPELHLVAVKTKDLQPDELVALRSHLQDDRRFFDVAGHGHGAISKIKEKEWREIFSKPSFDATQELPTHLANAADYLVQRARALWNMPRDSDSEDIWSRIPGIFHSGAKFDTLKFEVDHAAPKRVRKGGRAMERDAKTLSKGGGTVKPPPGFELVPHGNKGGYRKRTSAGYRYWYPSQGHGGNERSHAIAHHETMREHHRAAGAAATGDARDAHATAERIHASAFARHVQGAVSKDSRRRASMQADQASGMADFGLNMTTARLLTEKPHRPHAGLGEPEGVGLAKGQRVGSWVYSGTSDGPIAHGIESGSIVVGTLAPMAKGWPLQAPPAQTQRLAAEFEQRHDDQAGHWGGGGLAQWWQDTYAGQEHVTVPLWLQQAGLPYGTPTPAVAQGSLTPAEEALARIYQAADARCATGLRVAQAQRAGVKIVAG